MVSVTLFLLLITPIPKGVQENIAKDELQKNSQAMQFCTTFFLDTIVYQLKVFVEYEHNTKRERQYFPILSIPIIATNLVHQPAKF
jgi:hypothetical protein